MYVRNNQNLGFGIFSVRKNTLHPNMPDVQRILDEGVKNKLIERKYCLIGKFEDGDRHFQTYVGINDEVELSFIERLSKYAETWTQHVKTGDKEAEEKMKTNDILWVLLGHKYN